MQFREVQTLLGPSTTRNAMSHKLRLAGLITAGVITLGALGWGGWWLTHRPTTLLPVAITKQARDFTLYFYAKQVPAGYTLDSAHLSFDQGVLIMPLTSPGKPGIVLTEQSLPSKVTQEDLQKNGYKVDGTIAPATINSIEGRLLGTMIVASSKGRTLVLLNAPGNADKADLAALLQGLRAVTR